ncbi:MAG TPA: hypothetical protein VIP78_00770 [Candidatus Dormibacteraeota bacterium]
MVGTLLVAAIAVAAIVSSLLTLREQRRREWLERRIWTAPSYGAPRGRPAYPSVLRS